MNPALTAQRNLLAPRLGEAFPFISFLGQRRSDRDHDSELKNDDFLATLMKAYDGLLQRVLDQRTIEEFTKARDEALPEYGRIILTLAHAAMVLKPKPARAAMVNEAINALENEFKVQGRDRFGQMAGDQAVFTVWTLRRIGRLLEDLATAGPVPSSLKPQDFELAREFNWCSLWAQFHLDCMVAAIRFDKAVQPEVLEQLCDGMRAIVNAYGIVREGLDLRSPREPDPELVPEIDPTDEELELLNASMRDMASETVE